MRLVSEGVRSPGLNMSETDFNCYGHNGCEWVTKHTIIVAKNSYNRAFLSQKISTYVRLKFLNLRPTCDTLTVTNIVDNLLVDVDYTTYQTALL